MLEIRNLSTEVATATVDATLLRMVDAKVHAHALLADGALGNRLNGRPLSAGALLEGSSTDTVEHASLGAWARQGRASVASGGRWSGLVLVRSLGSWRWRRSGRGSRGRSRVRLGGRSRSRGRSRRLGCRRIGNGGKIAGLVVIVVRSLDGAVTTPSQGARVGGLFVDEANGSTRLHQVGRLTDLLKRRSRVGVADIHTMWSLAVVDVDDKHFGKVVALGQRNRATGLDSGGRGVTLLLRSLDSHRGAVHVKLAIADPVDPSPSQSVVARLDGLWDPNLELCGTRAVGVTAKVAGDVSRAASLDGVDDLPDGILGWLHVLSQRHLARSTSVDGIADEFKREGLSNGKDVLLLGRVVDAGTLLAGKIAHAVLQGRVVESSRPIWIGDAHFHMRADKPCHQSSDGCNGGSGEAHFGKEQYWQRF